MDSRARARAEAEKSAWTETLEDQQVMARYHEALARERAFAAEVAAKEAAEAMARTVQQTEADHSRQASYMRERFSQAEAVAQETVRRAHSEHYAAGPNLEAAVKQRMAALQAEAEARTAESQRWLAVEERAHDAAVTGGAARMDQFIRRDEARARAQHHFMTQRMADLAAASEAAVENALRREAAAKSEMERVRQNGVSYASPRARGYVVGGDGKRQFGRAASAYY